MKSLACRPGRTTLACYVISLSLAAWSYGTDVSMNELTEKLKVAEQLHREGAYSSAETVLLAALEQADQLTANDHRRAAILNNLGSVYHSQGKYLQAEQCYRRAMGFGETLSVDDQLTARVNLAALYTETGQYAKAERLGLHLILERRVMSQGKERGFARLLATLGGLEYQQGRYLQAERHELAALEIWQRVAPDSIETIQTLNNLGVMHARTRRDPEALACFERALEIAVRSLKPGDPMKVTLMANAAAFHAVIEGPAAGEAYYRSALEIAESRLGPEHPLVGAILASYASLLERANRKAEAKERHRRAEKIREAADKTDPRTYTVDLGTLLRGSSRR